MSIPIEKIDLSTEKVAWCYESYDRAFAEFIGNSLGKGNVPIVFATPDRARAQVARMLNLTRPEAVPLPYISISQVGDVTYDMHRAMPFKAEYRNVNISDDAKTSYNIPTPLPYDISYQVDYWSRTRYEAMRARRNLLLELGYLPKFIKVDLGDPFPTKIVELQFNGVTDNSILESGGEERVLRWTYSFVIKGWLPRPAYEVYLIHKIYADFGV